MDWYVITKFASIGLAALGVVIATGFRIRDERAKRQESGGQRSKAAMSVAIISTAIAAGAMGVALFNEAQSQRRTAEEALNTAKNARQIVQSLQAQNVLTQRTLSSIDRVFTKFDSIDVMLQGNLSKSDPDVRAYLAEVRKRAAPFVKDARDRKFPSADFGPGTAAFKLGDLGGAVPIFRLRHRDGSIGDYKPPKSIAELFKARSSSLAICARKVDPASVYSHVTGGDHGADLETSLEIESILTEYDYTEDQFTIEFKYKEVRRTSCASTGSVVSTADLNGAMLILFGENVVFDRLDKLGLQVRIGETIHVREGTGIGHISSTGDPWRPSSLYIENMSNTPIDSFGEQFGFLQSDIQEFDNEH